MKKPSILLIDDDDSLRRVMEFSLTEAGHRVQTAASGEDGLRLFAKGSFDAVVTDITMPGMSGMEVLAKVHERDAGLPVIMITAYGTIENAVQAMKQGAFDYITKPFDRDELRLTLDKALRMRRLEKENMELRAEVTDRYRFENIVGGSEKIREVLDLAGRVSASDATVLITGERGTGKELLAKGIHFNSSRAEGPFVAVNCAAIPETLVESELFGHVKGAFTGAVKDKEGKFELADGGTILLDEIGDLPMETQVALLRVLQEREFERVGSSRPISVDVRVIAATNRDLQAAVAARSFRQELFYRLNVFPILIPPLRERRDDISLLAQYLIARYEKEAGKEIRDIGKTTLDAFLAYDWPGNVRELQNVIERAVIMCDGDTLLVDEPWLRRSGAGGTPAPASTASLARTLAARERDLIEAALEASGGRISGPSGAATRLGLPRQTLESKIRALEIDKHRFKPV